MDADTYLLGSSIEEQARLGDQHHVWQMDTEQLWDNARIGPGQLVVDLGCGPGYAVRDLAKRVGEGGGQVIGVDGAAPFIKAVAEMSTTEGLGNVTAVLGDVNEVELADGVFDVVFARWVMCFLKAPAPLIAKAARWLKPGGRLVIMDYVNYGAFSLFPRSAPHARLVQAVEEHWRAAGGDLDIGGRLPAMMASAGLQPVTVHPIQRAVPPGSPTWRWIEAFLAGHVPELIKSGHLSATDAAEFWDDWRRRAATPGAFLWSPPMVGIIGRRST